MSYISEGPAADLIEFLKIKNPDGVISILCNNTREIEDIMEVLGLLGSYTVYNPQSPQPHLSSPSVILDFFNQLRMTKEKKERKGKYIFFTAIVSPGPLVFL